MAEIKMTILRVGPNSAYTDGWAAAFGGKKKPAEKKEAAASTVKEKATAKPVTIKKPAAKVTKTVTTKAKKDAKPVKAEKPAAKKGDAKKKAVTAKKTKK